jgi:Ca2+-binding EF-hand superfamily protein
MKILNLLAGSMVAASLMVAPAAFAAEPMKKHDMSMMKHDMDAFMKSCDMDHDGMVSKAEMMKHMEKMFDRLDTKKTGKLDSTQTEAFLKDFTKQSGA